MSMFSFDLLNEGTGIYVNFAFRQSFGTLSWANNKGQNRRNL